MPGSRTDVEAMTDRLVELGFELVDGRYWRNMSTYPKLRVLWPSEDGRVLSAGLVAVGGMPAQVAAAAAVCVPGSAVTEGEWHDALATGSGWVAAAVAGRADAPQRIRTFAALSGL